MTPLAGIGVKIGAGNPSAMCTGADANVFGALKSLFCLTGKLNFPVKQNNDFNAPNTFASAPVHMADGFPAPIFTPIPANGVIAANTALLQSQRYFTIPSDLHEGNLQSWNVAY